MDPPPAATTTSKARPPTSKPTQPTTTTSKATTKRTPTSTKGPAVSSSASVSSSPSTATGTLGPSPTVGSDAKSGLSTPAVAGIAAAGGLILLFILSVFLCKKRRARIYAQRPDGHDPSRDPINPNDVFPTDNKFDQRTPALAGDNSGIDSYLMTARSPAGDSNVASSMVGQNPRTTQTQPEYQNYGDHMQSHFGAESPAVQAAVTNRTQPPPLISTIPKTTVTPQSPEPLSPSQRARLHHQQQQQQQQKHGNNFGPRSPISSSVPTGDARSGADTVIFNDMGNQFILQSSDDRGDSFERDGSMSQSELQYRRQPGKNQEFNSGGARGYAPPQPQPYYSHSDSPSPSAVEFQRGGRPGPNNGSPYSSPRQNPSQFSPRMNYAQYQPHPSSQSYPQQSPQSRPMYSPQPLSPIHAQPQSLYSGGGPIRSPPMSPGYSQPPANYQQTSNYSPRGDYSRTQP
ncbi:hypothetical protein BGZ50_006929 [Haplosporangium sp. Z 11]|nr:hypothetical protein BGZ50_006929 [Haplosporangium sp. Z 11]